jgi:hypothetical protein
MTCRRSVDTGVGASAPSMCGMTVLAARVSRDAAQAEEVATRLADLLSPGAPDQVNRAGAADSARLAVCGSRSRSSRRCGRALARPA